MTVYVIADIKVTDDGWIPAYAASVHELVHKHGGKYLCIHPFKTAGMTSWVRQRDPQGWRAANSRARAQPSR
jgi:uncharacterized protein (DUF1330 family)